MSYDDPTPAYEAGTASPKKSGGRLFMFGGIGCALVMLVCCGAVGFGVYWATKAFTDDPEKIAALANEMQPLAVPPEFNGEFGMSFFGIKMVFYTSDSHNGAIMHGEFGPQFAGSDAKELQTQIQTQMGNRDQNTDVNFTDFETRTYVLFGEERDFEFATGEDPDSGMQYLRVMGTYPLADGGIGLLFIQAPTDELSAEQAEAIVLSLDPSGGPAGGIPLNSIESGWDTETQDATDEAETPAEETEPATVE